MDWFLATLVHRTRWLLPSRGVCLSVCPSVRPWTIFSFWGKFCTLFIGSASNLAKWYIWTKVTFTPKMGSAEFFSNFWRIFESQNLALFMGFLRLRWEILHIIYWIRLKLHNVIEKGCSYLHAKNGVFQKIFQFFTNFWKLWFFNILPKSEVFLGNFPHHSSDLFQIRHTNASGH